jgi:4-amino-4-deoxy-L-arabinose transferase-like glycosyltransferase
MTAIADPVRTAPRVVSQQPVGGRARRLLRGRPADPAWARPALLVLLGATALLYLWDLGASGYANDYYAAAVQAGTQSGKAMLFGSLDAGNAITVDKPALFLWPMELAGRIFGFDSWSMLAPQAVAGVASVGLIAATVRRISGPAAGLLAGVVLAVTPVAVLMFRFNNPDAMLTLLLVAAGYALVRALETVSTRWLVLAGALVGLGFITKMGQALLVVPAFGLVYLIAAPTTLRRRIVQLLAAGAAMVAGAGWWIALVQLWPASDRPYIGGSTTNSVLELAFGYNGLGRIFGGDGNRGGGGTGPGAGGGFGGGTGLTRLFSSDMATEISWLLPTALLALVAGLWLTRRAPRTDLTRAALVLFGGWLIVTGLVFSYMQGTIHPYYTVVLAPAIAAIVAITTRLLWQARATWTARITAAVLVEISALWSVHLLAPTPTFLPALRYVIIAASVVAVVGILAGPRLRTVALAGLVAAVLAGGAGTAVWAVDTAGQPHSGAIPSSGPVASQLGGGFGGGGFGAGGFGAGGPAGAGMAGRSAAAGSNTALTTLLKATTSRWAAATVGSHSAAPLQLAGGRPVMSIGGFMGSDPAPTLAQFQQDVAAGQVRYFIAGGGPGGGAGGGAGAQIAAWVAAHHTATTVGGTTVYDLGTS